MNKPSRAIPNPSRANFFLGALPVPLLACLLAFSPLAICQTLPTAGKWQRQQWSGITGGRVSALTSSPAFYLAPGSTMLSDSAYSYLGDSYGARTRGYITPAVTGLYTFWVCGDDEAQLYLAADGMKWSAAKIAGYIYPTNLSSYDVSLSQRSASCYLRAGEPCYIELLHKDELQRDHASVAWAVQPALASGVQNWATPDKGAVASSSGCWSDYPASRGMDGNPATFFHTNGVTNAWWMVDFRQDRMISSVDLVNRTSCCQSRMTNFRVSVEDVNGAVVAFRDFYQNGGSMGAADVWNLTNTVAGRRVRITFLGANRTENFMHLAEVQVHGPDTAVKNWALETGVSASQSTTYSASYPAANALDGNVNSFCHTNNSPGSWWQVDLGVDRVIDTVELINRQDAGAARLSNFRVSILDASNQVVLANDYYPTSGNVDGAMRWEPAQAVSGRKVRVELLGLNRSGDSYLHLGEVNVWGRSDIASSERGMRSAVPSSVMSSYVAAATNDADDDGYPDAWEALYGFTPGYETGVRAALADPDGDFRSNLQESKDGTDPFTAQGAPGFLSRSEWTNMAYYNLAKTRGDLRYFQPPQSSTLQAGSLSGALPGYSAGRIRGYLTPQVTGYYRFWISSGESAELWLSSVEGSKYHKQSLCAMSSELGSGHGVPANSVALWDSFSFQMSREVYLEAGKSYYLESDYQLASGANLHASVAWAKRDGIRQIISPACLSSYFPTPDDADDDFLPDAWELQYGLNPLDSGAIDNAREGEFGDFDGDGLSNREEYVLGTDPTNSDTDGDGESDGNEVNALGSNALVANAITDTFLSEVALGGFTSSSTAWTMTSGGLLADSFRGEATWDFSVPTDGNWLLRLDLELMGSTYGNEEVPMVIKVDGKAVVRRQVRFGSGKLGLLQALTPWLLAGNHQVTVLVDNSLARRTVRLVSLKIYAPSNAAATLAQGNRVLSQPASTRSSPAFVEGYARDPGTVTLNGVPAQTGTGNGHWFANVPLSNVPTAQPYSLQYEQGWQASGTFIWQATNVMDGESLTIRRGDALRVGAWSADPAMASSVTLSSGGSFALTGQQTTTLTFPTAGVFTVTGTLQSGASASLTVKVVAPPGFPVGIVDALDTCVRTLSVSASSEVAFDTQEDLSRLIVNRTATTASLGILPAQPVELGVAARLFTGGPILAIQRVNVIGVSDALQNDLTSTLAGNIPGYKLVQAPLTVLNLPPGARVDVSIYRAGVMFPNGTTLKSIYPANLTNGSVILQFLYPLGQPGGYCHNLLVYDRNGLYLGTR